MFQNSLVVLNLFTPLQGLALKQSKVAFSPLFLRRSPGCDHMRTTTTDIQCFPMNAKFLAARALLGSLFLSFTKNHLVSSLINPCIKKGIPMLQNKLEKEITSLAGYGVTLFGENSKWKFRWLLKQ